MEASQARTAEWADSRGLGCIAGPGACSAGGHVACSAGPGARPAPSAGLGAPASKSLPQFTSHGLPGLGPGRRLPRGAARARMDSDSRSHWRELARNLLQEGQRQGGPRLPALMEEEKGGGRGSQALRGSLADSGPLR